MELKGIEIINIYNSLEKLSDKELDLGVACIIAKNMKELGTVQEVIDGRRDKLIMEYAEKDKDGNVIQSENGVKIADTKAFSEKMNNLLISVTDVEILKINQDSLSGIKIHPKDIIPLVGTVLEG